MIQRIKRVVKTGDVDFVEILKHSTWAFILFGVASGLQFIFDVSLARKFGADGVGTFYLAFSALMITGIIGRLGINRAVVRFIPEFVKKKQWGKVSGVKQASYQLVLLVSLPLAVTVFFLAPFLANELFKQPDLTRYFRVFAAAIPALSLIYVQAGILRALKLIKESMVIERIGVYLFGIFAIFSLGRLFDLTGVVFGVTVGVYLAFILGLIFIKKGIQKPEKSVLFNKKVLLLISLPLLFVDFSNQMTGQLNIMLLGVFKSTEAVGIFNAALKLSMFIGIVLTSINNISATKISEFKAVSERAKLELIASKSSALALVVGTPLIFAFFIFPSFFLGLFGSEFTQGANVLRILIIGQVVNLAVGPVAYILAMTGHEKKLAYAIVGTVLILNTLLSALLIPPFGIIGAAIAVSSSIALKNIVLLVLVKQSLGIWSLPNKAVKRWISKV